MTKPGAVLAACGAPSVYLAALADPQGRTMVLHDQNSNAHRFGSAEGGAPVAVDFRIASPPPAFARTIVADPPWYPEFTNLFLWWSSRVALKGAPVLVALAPSNTRQSTERERSEMQAYGRSVGLKLREIEPNAVRYTTPPFESQALIASGVSAPPRWRTGDLAVFEAEGNPRDTPRPMVQPRQWKSVQFGDSEVRFRDSVPRSSDPRLINIVDGNTLDTVTSCHDTRRLGAMVWTTLNSVFACDNPMLAPRHRRCDQPRQ